MEGIKNIIKQNSIKSDTNNLKWYQLARKLFFHIIKDKKGSVVIDDDYGFSIYINGNEFITILRPNSRVINLGMMINDKNTFLRSLNLFCYLVQDLELFYTIKKLVNTR